MKRSRDILQQIIPLIIRWMKITTSDNEKEQQLAIRLKLARLTLDYINDGYAADMASNKAFTQLKDRYERMVEITEKRLDQEEGKAELPASIPRYRQLLLDLIGLRRQELSRMRHNNEFSDELLRSEEFELDLEEARMRR